MQWKNDLRARTEVPGEKFWQGENAPRGTAIAYWLKSAASDVKVTITDLETGAVVHTCVGNSDGGLTAGLNRFQWAFTDDRAGGGGGGGRGGGGGGGGAAGAAGAAGAGAGGGTLLRPVRRAASPRLAAVAAASAVVAAVDAAAVAVSSPAPIGSR